MNLPKTVLAGAMFLGAIVSIAIAGGDAANDLAARFQRPADAARPWVFWMWIDGNVSREGITADLEAMQRAGIGGVLIMEVKTGAPVGPVAFGSPAWRELFKHVVAEAGRLGLEVNMNNDAGWCGSGGPWNTPEHAMQEVVWTETTLDGPRHFPTNLRQPATTAGYYRDIAILAFPTPPADANPNTRFRIDRLQDKVGMARKPITAPAKYPVLPATAVMAGDRIIDVTTQLGEDGKLTWDIPAGRWSILRIGYTLTGMVNSPSPKAGEGLECDKLSTEAVDAHFAGLMAKLVADVGPAAGKTLVSTHIDSWEVGFQNWTPKMREEFRKRRGYDMRRYLPVMAGYVVDSLEVSERFLWDLRRTIADLISENYAGRMRELAHQHHLQLSIEAYGVGLMDNFTYAAKADVPMCEWWTAGDEPGNRGNKVMTSAAHVYGKPICGSESFTSVAQYAKWLDHPFAMKALGDMAFCDGVNRFVVHRYAHQPWLNREPGMTFGPWGVHFERTETWWPFVRPWNEYLARCNNMLRQGLFVADVCCLQTEDVPSCGGYIPSTPGLPSNNRGLPPGIALPKYDYDGCSPDAVLTRMRVENGRLVLPDGMSYRLLVLPPGETMTPVLLKKIKELVEAGATVVGPRPVRSPSLSDYPACDDLIKNLAAELWDDCGGKKVTEHRLGQGRIVWSKTPETVLAEMGVGPDFECKSFPGAIRYIHRAVGDTDIFFVANAAPRSLETRCTFRVHGKRPEFWHPDTSWSEPAAVYSMTKECTEIPVSFDPCGSTFVVFRPDKAVKSGDHMVSLTRNGQSIYAGDADRLAATKIMVDRAVYGVPGDKAKSRDMTALVRQFVTRGIQGFWVEYAMPGEVAPGLMKTLTVDYTIDGKSHTARATDRELIMLAGDGVKSSAATPHRDASGGLWIEAQANGRYEIAVPLRIDDPDVAPTIKESPSAAAGFSGTKFAVIEVAGLPKAIGVQGPWEVRFPDGCGAPQKISLDRLISLSKHPEPGVKYFSGTATYRKELDVPTKWLQRGLPFSVEAKGIPLPSNRVYLDLGRVEVIAQVKLNGHDLGIFWKPPFRVDVTDVIHAGRNVLEVEVANLWPNRLIGDDRLPADCQWLPDGSIAEWPKWLLEGKPSPTGRHTFTAWRLWTKDSLLLDSGLLGPVWLEATQVVPVSLEPGVLLPAQ